MLARYCPRCERIVSGDCECTRPLYESPTVRGYNRKWRRFRESLFRKRAKQGVVCAACGLAFGAGGFHADHMQPVTSEDDPLFFDPQNIQFLHPECHGKKTARDVRQGLTR